MMAIQPGLVIWDGSLGPLNHWTLPRPTQYSSAIFFSFTIPPVKVANKPRGHPFRETSAYQRRRDVSELAEKTENTHIAISLNTLYMMINLQIMQFNFPRYIITIVQSGPPVSQLIGGYNPMIIPSMLSIYPTNIKCIPFLSPSHPITHIPSKIPWMGLRCSSINFHS